MCVCNIVKVKLLPTYVTHTPQEFADAVMPMDPSKLFLQEILLKFMASLKNSLLSFVVFLLLQLSI